MPTAPPEAQLALLELAATDQALAAIAANRASLPEIAQIAAAEQKLVPLRQNLVLAQTEVDDLRRESRKLDAEIDTVRARSSRDAERLAAGTVPAKDLTNLQHEIEALARRQATLEDQSLELMERTETADAVLAEAEQAHQQTADELTAASTRRDDAFADFDDQQARLQATRAEQVAGLPADLLAVYDRVRKDGRIAAAKLTGNTCGACRLAIDAVALGQIRAAAPDEVVRCDECGAILVRT